MRDLFQVFITSVVVAVAALCLLVQLTNANHAVDQLHERDAVQQVSSGTGDGHHSVR